ncbi:MAG: GNAT family N-acetyltransferase [Syntrophorhabdales bacterium]
MLGRNEMSIAVTIREALLGDSETISRLTRELFLELGHTPPIADLKQSAQFCKEIVEKDGYCVFLALCSEGSAKGIITLSEAISIYAGGRFAVIREFYVVPEMRSMGVGKALWQKAKEFSRSKGWKRIEVTPPSKEEHMRTYRFYTREGFRKIGPRLKYENFHG